MVTAQTGDTTVSMKSGARNAQVNGNNVELDSPVMMVRGRTMVPLRFITETLGGKIEWDHFSRTVIIRTDGVVLANNGKGSDSATSHIIHVYAGTVIPCKLETQLSSDGSSKGDKFKATLNTDNGTDYAGLPAGTMIEGHVSMVRAKTDKAPGVLGLAFDRIRMPNGTKYAVVGNVIGLDEKSVETKNGRLVAKSGTKNDLTFVGIGAGGGALISILTKTNLVTDSLIGGALGYLYGELKKDSSRSNNVLLKSGTTFGLHLTKDLAFRTTIEETPPK